MFIVSGHPRSGTSMMMKALEAGGLELYYDAEYQPSRTRISSTYHPNKGGFFESGEMSNPAANHNTVVGHRAVKIMFPCVRKSWDAKVIYMARDPEERRQSYWAAFKGGQSCKAQCMLDQEKITKVGALVVSYNKIMENPLREFQRIAENGWPIDPALAAQVVDPALYRFRRDKLIAGIGREVSELA